MTTTIEMPRSNWTIYRNGVGDYSGSPIVGYENGYNRVMCFWFTTGNEGVSHIQITIGNIYVGTDDSGNVMETQDVAWCINTDSTSYANANMSQGFSPMGIRAPTNIGGGEYEFTIDHDITLLPNTTYYLWFFPIVTEFAGWEWNREASANKMILSGYGYESGVVYIDNGSSFETYQVYIDNGSSWEQYVPYIDNGSSWDACG